MTNDAEKMTSSMNMMTDPGVTSGPKNAAEAGMNPAKASTMPTPMPMKHMRRPKEKARTADRSQITMCLHTAESEQVMGKNDPHRSSSAKMTTSSSGTNTRGNTTMAEPGTRSAT